MTAVLKYPIHDGHIYSIMQVIYEERARWSILRTTLHRKHINSYQTCKLGAKRIKATKHELRRIPHPQRKMGTEAIGQERNKNCNTQGKLIGRFGGRESLHYKGPELNGGQECWLPSQVE